MMMQTDRPCVRIVEDESAVRKLFSLLMESSGFDSRCYESAEQFISDDQLSEPGCVLVDLELDGLSGMDLVDWINQQPNHLPTIVITGHGSTQSAVRCLKSGALDFVEKPVDNSALMELVHHAVELDASQRVAWHRLTELKRRYATLTSREQQVLICLAEGLRTKQVAAQLGIAPKTAEHHRGSVMKKMNASSVAELVKAFVDLGI